MEFHKVKKTFKVVGMKNSGAFDHFSHEVPMFAQQFLSRSNEIKNRSGTEVGLFEPKRDSSHREGSYYVGLLVNETSNQVPSGMEYIEINQHFITTRGKISDIGNLHHHLVKWAGEQGYTKELESYIVETYHPLADGEEEVVIYLPIRSSLE